MRYLQFINRLSSLISQSLAYYLPSHCFICDEKGLHQQILCKDCERNLPFLSITCELCANTLFTTDSFFCGSCLKSPPAHDRLIALFDYVFPINTFIIQLKFQRKLIYARLLGELFANKLMSIYAKQTLPEAIIPVPLHAKRLKERGFNQAAEIAKPIAKRLNIPLIHHLAYRTKPTDSQSSLSRNARKKNMQTAFSVPYQSTYQHIAILDDVTTTGETLKELSESLRKMGVLTIDSWCIAKRMLDYKA